MTSPLRAFAPLRETKTIHSILPLVLLLFAAALRFYDLGAQSLWYDEAYSWWLATQMTVGESLASSIAEVIPPGSYLLWRGWAALTGETEFALRMISALLGIVAVAAAGRVVWQLTRARAGFIAALALFAVAPPLLWASRELRMYSPLITFTLLADMALLEALFGPPASRRRWAWLWGLAVLLALYTYVLAGFWLIGQAVFMGIVVVQSNVKRQTSNVKRHESADQQINKSTNQQIQNHVSRFTFHVSRILHPASCLLLPASTAAALYLPWVMAAAHSLGVNRGYWPGHLPFTTFLRTTFQGITIFGFIAPDQTALALSGGILLLATLALALTRRHPLAGLYPLCYLLPITLLGSIYRNVPKWGVRHSVLFAPAPFLALAIAWGCAQRRSTRVALGLATALAAIPLLWADANLLTNPAFAHEDWRGAAQYVQTHRQSDDVVIIETGSTFPTWVYYAGNDNLLPLPDEILLDVTNVLHYGNAAPILNARLQNARRVWTVSWLADVTDPTDIVATLLDDIGEEAPLPVFNGLTVRRFDLTHAPDFPPEPLTTARPDVELLPAIRLWGYSLSETIPADAPLSLRMWWTTADPAAHVARFYQASLRLMEASGYTWARSDAPPGAGDYRPERWPANTLVMGNTTLTLPPGAPAGTYTATLILYHAGQTAEPFTLGTVRVTRPTHPPATPSGMTPVAAIPNDAPLALLAVRLDEDALAPCADMPGELFWEVQQPLSDTLRVQVALDKSTRTQALTTDFDPADWQVGDRFLSRFRLLIPCRAPNVTAPLTVTLLPAANDIPLTTWIGPEVTEDFGREFALPGDIAPLTDVVQTEIAALAAYRLEPDTVTTGKPFTLTLYWRVTAETAAPYTAFVHVTPPDAPSNVVVQHDSWPAQGARATYTWLAGEVVADAHPLPALPAGVYTLRVGLYGPDAIRLPLTVNGQPTPDNVYILPKPLEVQP